MRGAVYEVAARAFWRVNNMKRFFSLAAGALALACASQAAVAGPTLDAVKKKGFVQCGLTDGVSGFSATNNSKGEWEGMDVDICRAVAAAVFGDPTKFKGTALSTQQRFTALQSGKSMCCCAP